MRLAFLLNPIAGLGGTVGLKGTDGTEVLVEARRRGARESAAERATVALASCSARVRVLPWDAVGDPMGEAVLREAGFRNLSVQYRPTRPQSIAADTIAAGRAFQAARADLVVFAGGDGTAWDLVQGLGGTPEIPILGVPCGVKMHSGVFLEHPSDLGGALDAWLEAPGSEEAELVDRDPPQEGPVVLRGIARVPRISQPLPGAKREYAGGDAEEERADLAQHFLDTQEPDTLYILGPGTTIGALAKALGVPKTPLGFDLVRGGRLVGRDVGEAEILAALAAAPQAEILLGVIGGQGFVLGRGTQPITPAVLRRVGPEHVRIFAGPSKLSGLQALRVDTGDPALDAALKGRRPVQVGYRRRRLVEVA